MCNEQSFFACIEDDVQFADSGTDGARLLSLPQRTQRLTNLTIITVLRDPIERVGSQAFYGNTVFNRLLDPRRVDFFDASGNENRSSDLYKREKLLSPSERAQVMERIKTDETLWDRHLAGHTFGEGQRPQQHGHLLTRYFIRSLNNGLFD